MTAGMLLTLSRQSHKRCSTFMSKGLYIEVSQAEGCVFHLKYLEADPGLLIGLLTTQI